MAHFNIPYFVARFFLWRLRPIFATWFLSIRLFLGNFATAGDWGLGDSGWRHEKERRPRLTLQSTPSTITQQPSPRILPTFQVYFFNFSSVFHWPFQVVLFYILHHTFNLALNKFKHLTTIQDNYVVVLCRYSDMIILEIFHIMTYTYHLFIDLLQLKFNYNKDYQNVIKLTSLFFCWMIYKKSGRAEDIFKDSNLVAIVWYCKCVSVHGTLWSDAW